MFQMTLDQGAHYIKVVLLDEIGNFVAKFFQHYLEAKTFNIIFIHVLYGFLDYSMCATSN